MIHAANFTPATKLSKESDSEFESRRKKDSEDYASIIEKILDARSPKPLDIQVDTIKAFLTNKKSPTYSDFNRLLCRKLKNRRSNIDINSRTAVSISIDF